MPVMKEPTFTPLDQVALVVLPAAVQATQARLSDNSGYNALVVNSVGLAYAVATEFMDRVNAVKPVDGKFEAKP